MSEQIYCENQELTPNNPELFKRTLRKVAEFASQNGYDFPAAAYTQEELERNRDYSLGDYHDQQYRANFVMPAYAVARGWTDDSKMAAGHFVDYDIENNGHATVVLLGEGSSIKYGEFGSVRIASASPSQGYDHINYVFRNDGVVDRYHGVDDSQDEEKMYWERRQATDDELREISEAFEHLKSYVPPAIASMRGETV